VVDESAEYNKHKRDGKHQMKLKQIRIQVFQTLIVGFHYLESDRFVISILNVAVRHVFVVIDLKLELLYKWVDYVVDVLIPVDVD
jgi:hypothetical protein